MTDNRRDLFFKVMDGHWEALKGLMAMMNQHRHCDVMLTWLVKNQLTGVKFMAWYQEKFAPNPRRMFHHILSRKLSDRTM